MIKKTISVSGAVNRREWRHELNGSIDIKKLIDEELSKKLAMDEKTLVKIAYQTSISEEGESSVEEALTRLLKMTSRLKKGSAVLTMYTEDKEIIMYVNSLYKKAAFVVVTPEESLYGEEAFKLYKKLRGWYQVSFFSD